MHQRSIFEWMLNMDENLRGCEQHCQHLRDLDVMILKHGQSILVHLQGLSNSTSEHQ